MDVQLVLKYDKTKKMFWLCVEMLIIPRMTHPAKVFEAISDYGTIYKETNTKKISLSVNK